MTRLTEQSSEYGYYILNQDLLSAVTEGYTGEAAEKLAKFENFYDDLVSSQDTLAKELEILRNEGKEKTAKFRELFAKKLLNGSTLILLKAYDLE